MTCYTILPKAIRETQRRIESRVEALLEDAKGWGSNDRSDLGAINWADLDVIDVVYCVGKEGSVWYDVEISEAAPECTGLHKYIYDNLSKDEFPETIQVRTEW